MKFYFLILVIFGGFSKNNQFLREKQQNSTFDFKIKKKINKNSHILKKILIN
jgi:hypothetical protein